MSLELAATALAAAEASVALLLLNADAEIPPLASMILRTPAATNITTPADIDLATPRIRKRKLPSSSPNENQENIDPASRQVAPKTQS